MHHILIFIHLILPLFEQTAIEIQIFDLPKAAKIKNKKQETSDWLKTAKYSKI